MTAAVACVLYLWVAGAWRASGLVDPARLLNEFVAARQVDIPLDSDDALFGETNAPVRLVVFSDFNCPGCREFARTLPALHEFFRGRLAIYFKHYPLSCDCHPKLRLDLHPGSCQAAWAAEAARRQDRFRAFHDLLVAAPGATSDALLRAAARRVGLDLDRFDEDRENPAVRRKVAADLDLGTRLGVDGTPSIFLDGRRVRDLRPAALMFLVATRVEAAAP
jgi:protein-disulfide isomerase